MAELLSKNGKKIGRPKGGKSFTNVRMADLRANLGDNAVVPVSRVWIEKMGLVGCGVKLEDLRPAITPAPPSELSTPVEFTIDN